MKTALDYLQLCLTPLLVVLVITMMTAAMRRRRSNKTERLREFQPLPLLDGSKQRRREARSDAGGDCFNFAKVDYLSLSGERAVLDSAADCIRNYSVGTCGPRGFFGTVDVHLELEERLAEFMRTANAIVYSYGLVTMSSCIHCYCKRTATVFVDEHANYAIQSGVAMSTCRSIAFRHNDPVDFEAKLQRMKNSDDGTQSSLKVLVIEAISTHDGSLCPVPDFLAVCRVHKVRVLLDESISIGVLGEHGRGVTEHFSQLEPVDVIVGSLEHAFASHGGFCAGAAVNIIPQRVTSAGFVFSASLPTFCARVAITTLGLLGDRPGRLRALCSVVHDFLVGFGELVVKSDRVSPVKVFAVIDGGTERLNRRLRANRVYVLEWGDCLKMNLFLDLEEPTRLDEFFRIFRNCLEDHLNVSKHDDKKVII